MRLQRPDYAQKGIAEQEWRTSFRGDANRPPIDNFFVERYQQAQATPADYRLNVTDCTLDRVAAQIARIAGLE